MTQHPQYCLQRMVRICLQTLLLTTLAGLTVGEEGQVTPDPRFVLNSVDIIGKENRFRIYVYRSAEECFFEDVQPGDTLFVSFQVLSGGNRQLDVYVRTPSGQVVASHIQRQNDMTEHLVAEAGPHQICFDNLASKYSRRYVDAYIGTWRPDKWEAYKEDFDEFEISADTSIKSLSHLGSGVREMLREYNKYRVNMYMDMLRVSSNGGMVQQVSLGLSLLVILTSSFQVFFLRRLFRNRNKVTA